MQTKVRVLCKECIFATTETVKEAEMFGTTQLRCHKYGIEKQGFENCEQGKSIYEEAEHIDETTKRNAGQATSTRKVTETGKEPKQVQEYQDGSGWYNLCEQEGGNKVFTIIDATESATH